MPLLFGGGCWSRGTRWHRVVVPHGAISQTSVQEWGDACSDREAARLEQVLAHPQFIADPVSAITAHLEATLPPKPPPRQCPLAKGGAGSKRRRKREAERQRQMQTD